MQITINNTDQEDLFVSVWDLNTAEQTQLLSQVRINHNAAMQLNVSEDGRGKGHISWKVVRTNDPTRQAQRDAPDLSPFDPIDVTTQFG